MASAFNRGTRAKPNWYIKVKVRLPDGRRAWKMKPSDETSREAAVGKAREYQAQIGRGLDPFAEPERKELVGELLDRWAKGLANRNAVNDRSRVRVHLRPRFAELVPEQITVKLILGWLDEMRAAGKMSTASQRACLNLLSRFFSWAVQREHATINPVRQIPTGARPQEASKSDTPWIEDDATVRKLVRKLPPPLGVMFYLGNRSGLRTGEIAGLRLSDLAFLEEGVLRVRFSYDGPLKEDKAGAGKVKWVPAPSDAAAVLEPLAAARRAQGAGPEDLLFVAPQGGPYGRVLIGRAWREAAAEVVPPVKMNWYQATRHSFTSRNLKRGASLDQVSAAIGHSTPLVTRRYYDHFVRKEFAPIMREGLGLGRVKAGKLLPMKPATRAGGRGRKGPSGT